MSNARKVKAPAKPAPEVLGRGRYTIYQSPEGDGIISYRPDGTEEDNHQVVPARIWSVITGMLRGEITDVNPMALMKMFMGGK